MLIGRDALWVGVTMPLLMFERSLETNEVWENQNVIMWSSRALEQYFGKTCSWIRHVYCVFFQYWTCFLPHQENVFDVNDNCWLIDWYCVMFAGSWFADVVLFDVYWCVASLCNVLSIYVLWFTRCCLLATLAHSLQQRRTHSDFNSEVTKGLSCVQKFNCNNKLKVLQGIGPPWLPENQRLGLSVTLVSNPQWKYTMNTPVTVWDMCYSFTLWTL